MDKVIAPLFFFGLVILGGWYAIHLSQPLFTAMGAWGWDPVDCEVTSVKLTEISAKQRGRRRGVPTYRVDLTYKYEVYAEQFVGKRYEFAFPDSDRERRVQAVDALRESPETTCYFNPSDPNESVVDPSISLSVYRPPLVFFGIVIFATFMHLCFGNRLYQSRYRR